ncbi:MAG: hypothetical protein QM804_15675 [Propionicimonas sp.]
MLVVVGKVKQVRSREVEWAQGSFTETRVAIGAEDDLNASWCELGRDFGPPPEEGEAIAALAYVKTYTSSSSRTGAGFSLMLMRRVGLAEVMPAGANGARLAAVGGN